MTVYQSNQFNLGGYKAKHMLYTLDKVSYYNKQDGWQQHSWELVTRDNQVPPPLAAPWALVVSWTEYRLGRAWDSRRCPPWRWAAQGWRCAARRTGRAKPPPHEHSWKEYCMERERHSQSPSFYKITHAFFANPVLEKVYWAQIFQFILALAREQWNLRLWEQHKKTAIGGAIQMSPLILFPLWQWHSI